MTKYSGRRPLTAYHEAGHCLVRLYFGHSFEQVIVRSVAECRAGPLIDRRDREVACEGLVAGYNICSPIMTPAIAATLEGTPAQRDAFVRQSAIAAEISLIESMAGFVAEAKYRKVSRFVAVLDGGQEDLKYAERTAAAWFPDAPDAALTLAEDRAAALVQSPAGWRAVQGMAARLLADGVLDCETAEGIFADAYGRPVPAHGFWAEHWPPTLAMLQAVPA